MEVKTTLWSWFQELNLPHHAYTSSAFAHWVIFLGQKQTFIKKKRNTGQFLLSLTKFSVFKYFAHYFKYFAQIYTVNIKISKY